jgi:hypothetical protein
MITDIGAWFQNVSTSGSLKVAILWAKLLFLKNAVDLLYNTRQRLLC